MARFLLSYSRRDRLQAIALRQWLVAADPRFSNEVFLDVDPGTGIKPGTRWKDELRNALADAESMIVLLSSSWEASVACTTEFRAAENLGKRIFVLRLEESTSTIVQDLQWLNLFGDGPKTRVSLEDGQTVEFLTHGLQVLLAALHSGTALRPQQPQLAGVISDRESNLDALGIAGDVNTLAQILAATSVSPPLSVAVPGDWGTGKSSLMCQLRDRVAVLATRSSGKADDPFVSNVRQVVFNAWHYSDDHLWVGLVEHLLRELAGADDSGSEFDRQRDQWPASVSTSPATAAGGWSTFPSLASGHKPAIPARSS